MRKNPGWLTPAQTANRLDTDNRKLARWRTEKQFPSIGTLPGHSEPHIIWYKEETKRKGIDDGRMVWYWEPWVEWVVATQPAWLSQKTGPKPANLLLLHQKIALAVQALSEHNDAQKPRSNDRWCINPTLVQKLIGAKTPNKIILYFEDRREVITALNEKYGLTKIDNHKRTDLGDVGERLKVLYKLNGLDAATIPAFDEDKKAVPV